MIGEPQVALVFSPEPWFEDLHRHLTDHGGARVRQVVMDPSLALGEQYDTLVVSHRWPALTQHFVDEVHNRRRSILGVFDPAEPAGRDHLVSLGAEGTIANDAPMSTFLAVLIDLAPNVSDEIDTGTQDDADALASERLDAVDAVLAEPGRLLVVGGTAGAGRTEVALALAETLADRGERVLLVDADEVAPSLGQRLGLPIEPNLRTAIESVAHAVGDPVRCLQAIAPRFDLLCGLPNVALWSQIRPREVLDVIRALGVEHDQVVADVASSTEELDGGVRSRFGITRAIVAEAVTLVGVGVATPVGVSRLLSWVAAVRLLNPDAPVHLIMNRGFRGSFREAEIEYEVRRTFSPSTLTFLPDDRKIEAATWAAQRVGQGRFVRGVRRFATDAIDGSRANLRRRRRGGRTDDLSPARAS